MVYILCGLIVFLVLFVVFQEWRHLVERITLEDRHHAERQALLDRLMARNFVEYVQAEVARNTPPPDLSQQREEESFEVGV